METEKTSLFVVSVLAPDRPGIIADVSAAIFGLGGNLQAMSQTIMQGWFTMLICAAFPVDATRHQVEDALKSAGGFDVLVRDANPGATRAPVDSEPFIMTCVGDDKPGIVRRLSRCCAEKGVNITDVWNEVRAGRFITIFHLGVPRDVDPSDLRYDLEQVAREAGETVTLQHQDIFTATNSLQVHTQRGPRTF